MAWTYTGDPTSSEKDEYRFIIGDTAATEPILQDGEIEYVLATHSARNTRLYHLYDACAQFFARKYKRKVGPIEESPYMRQQHYERKAAYYKGLVTGVGVSLPKSAPIIFRKGMHDNGYMGL